MPSSVLLSLVTLGVSAQSNLKWNVNAGIGMSNWYGDDTDGTDAKFAYKVGIGLEVPFANTNVWSFQTGLNFISKGVKGNGVTDACAGYRKIFHHLLKRGLVELALLDVGLHAVFTFHETFKTDVGCQSR